MNEVVMMAFNYPLQLIRSLPANVGSFPLWMTASFILTDRKSVV